MIKTISIILTIIILSGCSQKCNCFHPKEKKGVVKVEEKQINTSQGNINE